MLILRVSSCDFIQLTSKAFLEFAHKKKLIYPRTNWNEVYAAATVKYVNKFFPQKKRESEAHPKRRSKLDLCTEEQSKLDLCTEEQLEAYEAEFRHEEL